MHEMKRQLHRQIAVQTSLRFNYLNTSLTIKKEACFLFFVFKVNGYCWFLKVFSMVTNELLRFIIKGKLWRLFSIGQVIH